MKLESTKVVSVTSDYDCGSAVTATSDTRSSSSRMGVPCGEGGGGSGNFCLFNNSERIIRQSLERPEDSTLIPAVRRDAFACNDGASSSSKPPSSSSSSRRRDRRPPWKPYWQLTWQEKKDLEEKERLRAERRRSQLTATTGRPMAPYNTSQFLMADQQESESTEDEDVNYVALDRGYAEEWAKVLKDNLEKLSKDHLKVHAVEVEREVAELRRRLRILEQERETGRT